MSPKKANYGKLAITVESAEKKDSSTLEINFAMKNNASVQTIIFPDEEIRLVIKDKIIPLESYKFENNLDPNQESKGYMLFKVPAGIKSFTLQFGKKVLAKTNIELKL